MKLISLLTLSAFLTISACAHKKSCCNGHDKTACSKENCKKGHDHKKCDDGSCQKKS